MGISTKYVRRMIAIFNSPAVKLRLKKLAELCPL